MVTRNNKIITGDHLEWVLRWGALDDRFLGLTGRVTDTSFTAVTDSVDIFVDSWSIDAIVDSSLHACAALMGGMKGLKDLMAEALGYHKAFV